MMVELLSVPHEEVNEKEGHQERGDEKIDGSQHTETPSQLLWVMLQHASVNGYNWDQEWDPVY